MAMDGNAECGTMDGDGARGDPPCLTIFVPFFNDEPFLERSLASAVGQTLRNIEVLCVDDASTDGSVAIAAAFAQKDGRVRILRNGTNQGINRVRCRGVREARGEFFLALDSDDALEVDIAEVAVGLAMESGADVVEFRKYVYGKSSRILHTCEDGMPTDVAFPRPLNRLLRRPLLEGNTPRLIRRSTYLAALDLLGQDFCCARVDLAEDLAHGIAVYRLARSGLWTKKIGYHYHRRDGSLTCCDAQTLPSALAAKFSCHMRAIRRAMELLNGRQRAYFLRHVQRSVGKELDFLHTWLTPDTYAVLLAPYCQGDYFGKFFSFGSLLRSLQPELFPVGWKE
ncbi:MAG: glycosyltransferase [Puniceicoccales bacterium]|nr:glycosyltransferase [Puniceicoccales bacterium]